MDSEVIAINTFRDPSLGGAGISGSILISLALPLLDEARSRLHEKNAPFHSFAGGSGKSFSNRRLEMGLRTVWQSPPTIR